ncbi:MAG TPA: hypothetical protein V6D19_18115 [Stenomitos sp.]
MKIFQKIKQWYGGKDVKDDPDAPDTLGGMMVMNSYHKEFHWSAELARRTWKFISRNRVSMLTLVFTALTAIGTLGLWLYPIQQIQPPPVAPVLNKDNASEKTPPPSTKPHKKFSKHDAPFNKNNQKIKSI